MRSATLWWSGDRCRTTTKAMPQSLGICRNNVQIASRPPADAPMPTTGKSRWLGLSAGFWGEAGCLRDDFMDGALYRPGRSALSNIIGRVCGGIIGRRHVIETSACEGKCDPAAYVTQTFCRPMFGATGQLPAKPLSRLRDRRLGTKAWRTSMRPIHRKEKPHGAGSRANQPARRHQGNQPWQFCQ